jgi:hypothetical protein
LGKGGVSPRAHVRCAVRHLMCPRVSASIHAAPRRGRCAARHDGLGHKVERAVALVSVWEGALRVCGARQVTHLALTTAVPSWGACGGVQGARIRGLLHVAIIRCPKAALLIRTGNLSGIRLVQYCGGGPRWKRQCCNVFFALSASDASLSDYDDDACSVQGGTPMLGAGGPGLELGRQCGSWGGVWAQWPVLGLMSWAPGGVSPMRRVHHTCVCARRVHHGCGVASIHAAPRRGRSAARHDGPGHEVKRAVATVGVDGSPAWWGVWSPSPELAGGFKARDSRVSSTLRSYDALKQPFSSEQGT